MKSLTLSASIATALLLSVTAGFAAPKHAQRLPAVVPMPPEKPLILAENASKPDVTQSVPAAAATATK